jgi:rubrerythrin
MASRLAKLRRIVAVQEKLHRMEEFRLAALERRAVELREDEASVVASLNDSETFAGLFVDAMANQLRRIARETTRVSASQAEQGVRVREAALRLKRTERFTDKTARAERHAEEKRVFQELLDALRGGTGDASPV